MTEGNLETAAIALQTQLSDLGANINIGMGKLVLMVPRALAKEARVIVNSPLRSNTADNDLNDYLGKYEIFVNPFIGAENSSGTYTGSDTAWYLIAMGEHEVNFIWRSTPEMKDNYDFDTDTLEFKVYARFDYGWSDWRGTWGSKGDGASYSS